VGGVGGDDDGDDGEFLAAVWASGDAVSRWECVAEAVAGVNGVADVVDVVGDAVGCGGGLARRLFGSVVSSSGGWGFGW
jgi:hypothetical protein